MDSEQDVGDNPNVLSKGLTRLEKKLDALETFNGKMNRLEEVLLEVQQSISSQSILLQELQGSKRSGAAAVAGSPEGPTFPEASGTASAPLSSRSILRKQVRTVEAAELIPVPQDSPVALAILPGEVNVEPSKGHLDERKRRCLTSCIYLYFISRCLVPFFFGKFWDFFHEICKKTRSWHLKSIAAAYINLLKALPLPRKDSKEWMAQKTKVLRYHSVTPDAIPKDMVAKLRGKVTLLGSYFAARAQDLLVLTLLPPYSARTVQKWRQKGMVNEESDVRGSLHQSVTPRVSHYVLTREPAMLRRSCSKVWCQECPSVGLKSFIAKGLHESVMSRVLLQTCRAQQALSKVSYQEWHFKGICAFTASCKSVVPNMLLSECPTPTELVQEWHAKSVPSRVSLQKVLYKSVLQETSLQECQTKSLAEVLC